MVQIWIFIWPKIMILSVSLPQIIFADQIPPHNHQCYINAAFSWKRVFKLHNICTCHGSRQWLCTECENLISCSQFNLCESTQLKWDDRHNAGKENSILSNWDSDVKEMQPNRCSFSSRTALEAGSFNKWTVCLCVADAFWVLLLVES